VPPETAAFLGWPHLTSVVDTEMHDGVLRATRETEDGYETWEVPMPAVVSLAYGRDADGEADGRIDVWTARDLVDDVRENDKRFGQTGSPTRVLAVRDVTPERAGDRYTSLDTAVERIRALAGERGPEPTSWDKPERLGEQPSPKRYDCWTFVELVDGSPSRASLELLAKGRELSGKLGGENVALVFGPDVSAELARHGADRVALVDGLDDYDPHVWASALRQVLVARRPHVVLIPATANGRDLGPRVAGELELGMTGDCVGLNIDRAGRLIQTKPAYGGNIVSVIMGATTPQLATVRPRMFEPLEPQEGAEAEVRSFRLEELAAPRSRLLSREDGRAFELDEADVVVAAGAGVGGGVDELRGLASKLGGVLGGDRGACEAGLVPVTRQLGLLGRAVAPRLYVAVETGGDFEHAVASVKAAVIVVFKSSEAPVTGTADVALGGDWREAFPRFAAALGTL
jgi:electron transfer flavoprotein alpha subunit